MKTYVIGDIQGCYDPLMRLLDRMHFDERRDRLWFVGDLVNRGPRSLQTLRFIRRLGDRATVVLGNHDLHLLVVAAGIRKPHRGDTIQDVLDAPDRDELIDWLRRRNLMHVENGYVLVHAGLLPQWTVWQARRLAGEVEDVLRSPDYVDFLKHMYGNTPTRWSNDLTGYDRLRVIVNGMTRLRVCDGAGNMEFSHNHAPVNMPPGYLPWFEIPKRKSTDGVIIFGHWAALGVRLAHEYISLDSGCLWGRELSAYCLEDRQLFQCDCTALGQTAPDL